MKNEIRFTLESKQKPKLAQEIGNILGTAPHYERVPSCAYDIAGYRLDKEGVLHIPEGTEKETVEDLILQLRERGFQDDAEITEEVPVQQDKLTIVISRESLTDIALENLQKITANKQTLFQRAFRTDSTEIEITAEKINFTWFPDLSQSSQVFRKALPGFLPFSASPALYYGYLLYRTENPLPDTDKYCCPGIGILHISVLLLSHWNRR